MGVVNAVEWVTVESGLFSSAAYRASARQLYLRFQDGKIYRFFDCPVTVYNEFIAAASQGRYFSQQIRKCFRFELVRRGSSGNRGSASSQPSLADQLRASVLLAKARAVQQCDITQAMGTQECIRELKGCPAQAAPKQDSWVTRGPAIDGQVQRLRAAQAAGVRSASF